MNKIPKTYNWPRLNLEEIENQNRLISSKENESVIKNLSIQKKPKSDDFPGELYQTFKELMPILLKLFQKTEENGTLPIPSYKASFTQIPKPHKNIQENYRAISQINTDTKILDKILTNQIQQNIKRIKHHGVKQHLSLNARMVQYMQINKCDIPH